MKRNGRAKNGVHAKRRRARIARRLAYALPKARDRAVASEYLEAVFPGARIVWRGYDRYARRFQVAVFHPPPRVWIEPMKITVGFAERYPDAEPFSPKRPAFHTTGTLEPGGWEKMDAYLRTATITPKQARAEEVIRLINEGKVRVEPPLPDPFEQEESDNALETTWAYDKPEDE